MNKNISGINATDHILKTGKMLYFVIYIYIYIYDKNYLNKKAEISNWIKGRT